MTIERRTLPVPGRLALAGGGGGLGGLEVAYEAYGVLAPARDNAVLLLHGLTADQHAAGPTWAPGGKPGWWDAAIGPGKALDTDRFHVLCPNVLGGAGGTTGPASRDPGTGRAYGPRFPLVTVGDMVELQRLFLDELGIGRLHAVVGGCMGGFQALEWLARHPPRVGRAVAIGATPRTTAHNLALWSVLRALLESDPAFAGGDYHDGPARPDAGVGLLAMVGAMFWMSRATLERRFGLRTAHGGPPRLTLEPEFAVERFLHDVRANAAGRLDANSFIRLTRAIDHFDLARERGGLEAAFAGARGVPVLLASYRSDWRYPPEEIEPLHQALLRAGAVSRHVVLDSAVGHGAFLYDFPSLAPVLAAFLTAPG